MTERQPIIFSYWKDDKLMGHRCDTFNTISMKYVKIYHFSRSQVDTVIKGIRSGCNRAGTHFAKALASINTNMSDMDGNGVSINSLIEHMSKTEKSFQEWGEFECRIHPFVEPEEFYGLGEGDEWKREKLLTDLQPAIEVHKFKIMENSN